MTNKILWALADIAGAVGLKGAEAWLIDLAGGPRPKV